MTPEWPPSRATLGHPIKYEWRGVQFSLEDDFNFDKYVDEIAKWMANQEILAGNLLLARKERYISQTRAFVRQKLDRVRNGKAFPVVDVKPVRLALEEGIPVYELRWSQHCNQLKEKKEQLFRQYCGEPISFPDWIFGLLIHLKEIDGLTEKDINEKQEKYMRDAVCLFKENNSRGWSL